MLFFSHVVFVMAYMSSATCAVRCLCQVNGFFLKNPVKPFSDAKLHFEHNQQVDNRELRYF